MTSHREEAVMVTGHKQTPVGTTAAAGRPGGPGRAAAPA